MPRPPRGYRMEEYGLPHIFSYRGALSAESATQDATILTILRYSEACANPDTIEVNPRNANFARETGATCCPGSIVPRITMNLDLWLSKGAIETDKIQRLKVNWFPIYTAFLDSLDAADDKTTTDVEGILKLQHETTNRDVYPLNVAKLLDADNQPLSTINDADEALGDYGLTTTAVLESVAFVKETMYDARSYYTNQGMIRKVMGKMRTIALDRTHGYHYFSNNFTYPTVKRLNPYTFCGILISVPSSEDHDQLTFLGDTTVIPHVNFNMKIRFDEWNPNFDQSAT